MSIGALVLCRCPGSCVRETFTGVCTCCLRHGRMRRLAWWHLGQCRRWSRPSRSAASPRAVDGSCAGTRLIGRSGIVCWYLVVSHFNQRKERRCWWHRMKQVDLVHRQGAGGGGNGEGAYDAQMLPGGHGPAADTASVGCVHMPVAGRTVYRYWYHGRGDVYPSVTAAGVGLGSEGLLLGVMCSSL